MVRLLAAARYVGKCVIASIPTGDITGDADVALRESLRYRLSGSLAAWFAFDILTDADWQDAHASRGGSQLLRSFGR